MLKKLLGFFFVISCHKAFAQNNLRFFIPVDLHVGASLANMEGSPTANISNRVGISVSAFSGIMLRYKDRFGLAIEGGGTLNEYRYASTINLSGLNVEAAEYSIQHVAWSTKARMFYIIPLKKNRHSDLRIGLGGGYLFTGQASRFGQAGAMSIFTEINHPPVTFIEPEIGLTKLLAKNQIDLGLTYHYNFAPARLVTSRITVPGGTATAYTKLNYAALVIRFHPEILRNRKPKARSIKPEIIRAQPLLAEVPEYNARESRERVSFDLGKRNAVLKFKDNSEIDGDTISVYLNGAPILVDYGLVKKEKKIKIELKPGENTITVIAKNEGKVPPNTASCRIRSGLKHYQLTTSTGLKQNEVIKLNYQP